MKVFYVVYNEWNKDQKEFLAGSGVKVDVGYSRIDIEDNDENRPALRLIEQWKIPTSVGTLFDKKDLDKSSLFVYSGVWENGYPQPEADFGYMDITYDTSAYCKICGMGAIQKASFQIRKEPNWGKKKMFELNWVMDEIFVNNELFEGLFKGMDISKRTVFQYKKGVILTNTIQLDIPHSTIPLELQEIRFEICNVCGQKKYNPQIKGFFPGFKGKIPDSPIFKSMEFFGFGAQAYQRIFINRMLFDRLKDFGIKPSVIPVQP